MNQTLPLWASRTMPRADRRSDSVDPRPILLRGHNLGTCAKFLQSVEKGLGSIVLFEISNVGPDPRGSDTVAGIEPRIQQFLSFEPFQPSTIACNDCAVRKMGISGAGTAVFAEIAGQQGRSPKRLVRLRPLVQLLAKTDTLASSELGHAKIRSSATRGLSCRINEPRVPSRDRYRIWWWY